MTGQAIIPLPLRWLLGTVLAGVILLNLLVSARLISLAYDLVQTTRDAAYQRDRYEERLKRIDLNADMVNREMEELYKQVQFARSQGFNTVP